MGHLLEEIQYLVKVVSAKAKCTTFDELRFENGTCKEASLINLPLAFNFIKGHLYHCFLNIQEENSIFDKTESHANPWKFCWGIDCDVMFWQDKMLLLLLKHYIYILRCGCKSTCTKQCKLKKIAPSFANAKDYTKLDRISLKTIFGENEWQHLKRKR